MQSLLGISVREEVEPFLGELRRLLDLDVADDTQVDESCPHGFGVRRGLFPGFNVVAQGATGRFPQLISTSPAAGPLGDSRRRRSEADRVNRCKATVNLHKPE